MKNLFNKYCDFIGVENEGSRRILLLLITIILLPIFNVVNDSRIFFFGYSDFDKIISILLPIPTGFFISFLIVALIIKTLNLIKDGFEK